MLTLPLTFYAGAGDSIHAASVDPADAADANDSPPPELEPVDSDRDPVSRETIKATSRIKLQQRRRDKSERGVGGAAGGSGAAPLLQHHTSSAILAELPDDMGT